MHYYLSLGSNLNNREQTLRAAIEQIEQRIGTVNRCSSFFYSEPWGFESENEFCNVCCRVETALEPLAVLQETQAIERALGRTHKSTDGVYSDRTIDIDLIQAFDDKGKEVICDISCQPSEVSHQRSLLTLPHPLWEQRDFVKIPLAEIMS